MINTKYVRENLVQIRETLKSRASNFPLDDLLAADEKWRKLKTELQELQAKRNKASLEISEAKKKGQEIKGKIAALASLKKQMEAMEKDIAEIRRPDRGADMEYP